MMFKRMVFVLIWMACCGSASLWSMEVKAAPSPQKVLILYSWNDQMPWQAGVRAGMLERLQQIPSANRPEIFEERLDAARINTLAAHAGLAHYLQEKYAQIPLDAIIAESRHANDFLAQYPILFPGTKRYAVNVTTPGGMAPERVFVVEDDSGRALQTILQLMPDRQKILVVLDNATSFSGRTKAQVVTAAAPLSIRSKVEILDDFSFDELYARAHTLPPYSALLYLPVFQDRLGVKQVPKDVATKLASVSNAPVFVHHDSFLGSGAVGGYLISAPRVGELIARIAQGLSLPQGRAEIDAIVKTYQFDDRQLQRWGIADDRLPKPYTLIGKKTSLLDTYRWQMSAIIVVLSFESFLILLLIRNIRERRRALHDLGHERAMLEQRVQDRTAALAESESHLRTIFDNEPECIKIMDAQGRLMQMNAAGLAMIEADTFDQVAGLPVVDVIAPAYREKFLDLHQQVLAGHKMQMQFEVVGLKGRHRWLETLAVPMQSHGNAVHLAVTRDIDERKKAETELEQQRCHLEASIKLLQHITAQLPGMVFQYQLRPDGTSCLPYASDGIMAVYRVTPEDVREDAAPMFTLVHPDDLTDVKTSILESARTGHLWRHRYRLCFADGTMRWVQGNAAPQREADGGCLWHGFLTDATEEVAAENKLRLAASVFSNAQEGITITDAGGFIVDVNPAFTRITGYVRDEVLGRTPKFLSSGHHDAVYYARMWQSLGETGAWRGEIWNRNKSGEVYPELLSITEVKDGTGQISHYIGSFSDITGIKENEAQLDRLAHYDPLTDLPNRRLMVDRLRQGIAQTQRSGKIMVVCMFDLDKFKPINDALGHDHGDAVLVEVASRVTACLREHDTVARLGGDEFVMLLLNLEWVEECDAILSRIVQGIAAPMVVNGTHVHVSASMGVTLFPQDDGNSEQLLSHADQAMYQAKQSGGNRYQMFNTEHDRLVRENRRLIEDVSQAIEQEQFILHYQPKVEMATGRVVGAEALIRWRHPERGLLMPAEFLYAMTGTELEISLGHWVLYSALGQMAIWKAQGTHLPVSINLSARYLQSAQFGIHLAKALAHHSGVVAADLEIEIQESEALLNVEDTAGTLQACQSLGVRVTLDDFGTGYSSLLYFRRLPVDMLKIDQRFVRDMHLDPDHLAIVEGVVKIAKAFNRDVIAVGVESTEQCQLLKQMGCSFAQGYTFAQPMPADSFMQWMAQRANVC
jgi:diguanylate cyclase (GGDEF)-like protein/PAS domain S-box-containing protein